MPLVEIVAMDYAKYGWALCAVIMLTSVAIFSTWLSSSLPEFDSWGFYIAIGVHAVLVAMIPIGFLAIFTLPRTKGAWTNPNWWLTVGIWKLSLAFYAVVAGYFIFLAPVQRISL